MTQIVNYVYQDAILQIIKNSSYFF